MSDRKYAPSIRSIAEEPWQQFPGHYGGALSKALVRPETVGVSVSFPAAISLFSTTPVPPASNR